MSQNLSPENKVTREELLESLSSPIVASLELKGITKEFLAEKLKAELEAQETKFFAHKGEVLDERNVVAWDVRQRARIDAHKLRGDYPVEKKDVDLNLGVKGLTDDQLDEKLSALLKLFLTKEPVDK